MFPTILRNRNRKLKISTAPQKLSRGNQLINRHLFTIPHWMSSWLINERMTEHVTKHNKEQVIEQSW